MKDFIQLSEDFGCDITLIQGAGGNISLKNNDTMLIKASGMCLSDAAKRDIFTTVSIGQTLQAVQDGHENFVAINDSPLRPSIETPLHALIPYKIVLHIHCIDSIARSLSPNAVQELTILLKDFSWAYIPYARPGVPLALLVQKAVVVNPTTDIFILENHGLIIAADSCEGIRNKFSKVQQKLQLAMRSHPNFDADALHALNTLDWIVPTDAAIHSLATDKESLKFARQGLIFPDYVVFLGATFPVANDGETAEQAFVRLSREANRDVNFIVFPNKGILLSPTNSQGQNDVLYAFALLCSRIAPIGMADFFTLKTLTAKDLHNLTHWDAEKYRQSLEEERK